MSAKSPIELHPGFEKLDDREREVLKHLLDGKESMEISFAITCAKRTVDQHRYNIMEKLGIEDPKELLNFTID